MKALIAIFSLLIGVNTPSETRAETTVVTELFGHTISAGAASGYINDTVCKNCHPKHWEGFQEVGMSHSFLKPEPQNFIENFETEPYYHAPSQRYYKYERRGEDLYFVRYQLDKEQVRINLYERKVDWLLGSGNKARSYLFQNESGEMFQFPLGWYTETQQWRMSPGFEENHHQGLQRQVRRECMFCHNAFPEVETGSDAPGQPHVFPKELPQGIGCQRCHGPGSNHIQTVMNGGSLEQIHSAIVNPAKLPVKQRDSVCFQCHMLPAVSIIGMRNIERNDYSFRPGEKISDYLLHVDVTDANRARQDRFEINHHAYRLAQSKCFTESKGQLTCISCHNPHKKIKEPQRIEHYSSVCLNCHKSHDVSQQTEVPHVVKEDCMSCHMPQRRTQDVIEVVMTDHKIQKTMEPLSQRLAALERQEPIIESVDLLFDDSGEDALKRTLYTLIPVLRTLPTAGVLNAIEQQIISSESVDPMFYLDLAVAQVKLGQHQKALQSLEKVLKSRPDQPKALQLAGLSHVVLKNNKQAEKLLQRSIELQPKVAESYFNLGLLYLREGRIAESEKNLQRAKKLRPTLSKAWFYSGYLQSLEGQSENAIKDFEMALKIDPRYSRVYLSLAEELIKVKSYNEALRYLDHGISVLDESSQLQIKRDILKAQIKDQ